MPPVTRHQKNRLGYGRRRGLLLARLSSAFRAGSAAVHADPLDNLKHWRVNLAVGLVGVMVFLQTHDWHWLGLVFLDLLGQATAKA
jgi:hypothetical protein